MVPGSVAALVRRQHGVCTRAEIRRLGMSDAEISSALRAGTFVRVHPGIYRHAAVAPSWNGRMLAACRTTSAPASHRAAANVHGLEGFDHAPLEVSVPHGRRRSIEGVVMHQSRSMATAQVVVRIEIAVTGLARTVLDLGAVVAFDRVLAVVDQVIREARLMWRHLYTVLAAHSKRGRDGCGVLPAVLAKRDGIAKVPLSEWSQMAADLLVSCGLQEPVLEVDRERIRSLAAADWITLPLTWTQFGTDGAAFAEQVRIILARRGQS